MYTLLCCFKNPTTSRIFRMAEPTTGDTETRTARVGATAQHKISAMSTFPAHHASRAPNPGAVPGMESNCRPALARGRPLSTVAHAPILKGFKNTPSTRRAHRHLCTWKTCAPCPPSRLRAMSHDNTTECNTLLIPQPCPAAMRGAGTHHTSRRTHAAWTHGRVRALRDAYAGTACPAKIYSHTSARNHTGTQNTISLERI